MNLLLRAFDLRHKDVGLVDVLAHVLKDLNVVCSKLTERLLHQQLHTLASVDQDLVGPKASENKDILGHPDFVKTLAVRGHRVRSPLSFEQSVWNLYLDDCIRAILLILNSVEVFAGRFVVLDHVDACHLFLDFVNLGKTTVVRLVDAHGLDIAILHKQGYTIVHEDAINYYISKSDVEELFLVSVYLRPVGLRDKFELRLSVNVHTDIASLPDRRRLVVLLLGQPCSDLAVLGFQEVIGGLEGTPAILTANHDEVVAGRNGAVLAVLSHVPEVAEVDVVHRFIHVLPLVLVDRRYLTPNPRKESNDRWNCSMQT